MRPHNIALGLLTAAVTALCVRLTVGLPWPAVESALDRVMSPAAPLAAALIVGAASLRRGRRSAGWLLIALGQLIWAFGAFWYSAVLWNADPMPFPSVADAAWIAFYVPTAIGIVLLAHHRGARTRLSHLDAAIAALALTGAGAAVAFGPIVDATGGSPLAIATNLAYPLGDLVLVALVVGALAVAGWAVTRAWAILVVGFVIFAVTDTAYLFRIAEGTYAPGSLLDAGWVVASTLTAYAAWQPDGARRRTGGELSGFILPVSFSLLALATLVYDHFNRVHVLALTLATLCIAAVIVRMTLIFQDNLRMLRASHAEAATDALTGLGNRRSLLAALDGLDEPALLVLFDLDGFKVYNDTFGHVAGDALLARLGRRLEAVAGPGAAYRLGGDEFCVVLRDVKDPVGDALRLGGALQEHGNGFAVTSSYGFVTLPDEASTPTEALRLADDRMYAQKQRRDGSAGRQSKDVLLRALAERDPDLADHVMDVAALATRVAEELELPEHEVEQIRHAAELHDVGKVAIPEAILGKPGPLTLDEWEFVHHHTAIGERIISAAPALAHVARLVRSSHERWDGAGYPDGLRGEEIPVGARVLAACDALCAMVGPRPYRDAVAVPAALAELERCAGTQFDPAVVAALRDVVALEPALHA